VRLDGLVASVFAAFISMLMPGIGEPGVKLTLVDRLIWIAVMGAVGAASTSIAWFGWEAQIGPLAEAGLQVIAPDQRGYNLSDKPDGVSSYKMGTLVEDILGLADAFGYNSFHLAGHDFGAMVGWNLAMRYPERLKRLAIANVPHPAVMQNYLRTHPSQMLKSWYAFFFQLPSLPERVLKTNNWQFLISAMPDNLSKKERDRYREAWAQPKAMTSMINWYRAVMRGS